MLDEYEYPLDAAQVFLDDISSTSKAVNRLSALKTLIQHFRSRRTMSLSRRPKPTCSQGQDCVQQNTKPSFRTLFAKAAHTPALPVDAPWMDNRPEVSSLKRNKRYKTSFYDCISLYCNRAPPINRTMCILSYCHRAEE